LAFLLNLEQRLVKRHNLFVVLLSEVLHHRNSLACFALFKSGGFRTHVPADAADLVGFMVAVTRHNYGVFKFIVDSLLGLDGLGWFTGVALSFLVKSHHLFIYQLQTVVNGEVLADVVDD